MFVSRLREYLPLEQGLRLCVFTHKHLSHTPRVSSIRTRIKTPHKERDHQPYKL